MIEVKNLTKRYGVNTALDNVSFTVDEGTIVGFLGPNGAGKSTTMNIITGYLSATSGSVTVQGKSTLENPNEVKKLIGYLPEMPPLYLDMTVKEYLNFMYELKGVKLDRQQHIGEICRLTKIDNVYNRLVGNLSKGYKQRVGIAQALLNEPKLLILDEPTAGLDPKERAHFRNLLASLSRDCTVIISTHIVSDVESIANQVILLRDHRVLRQASIGELCADLEGCVYETSIEDSRLPEFEKKYQLLAQRQEHGKLAVRFIDRAHTVPDAVCVPPNLEDVFLATYEGQPS